MKMKSASGPLLFALACCSGAVQALDWQWGEAQFSLKNSYSVGAAMRMQDRNGMLVGKLNTPGQQDLCATDNCISFTGDPEPNARLVRAGGAFSGVNQDDGNLNYDKYDLVAATNKLNSVFTAEYGEFVAKLRAIGYYDPVNAGFDEHHTDTRYQPARSERPSDISRDFAKGVNLYDAYLQYNFSFGERNGLVSIGQQYVRWGEANLVAINSLSEINPPNAAALRMPGSEISEVFQPVPLLLLSTDISEGLSADFIYQFGWKAVQADPRGSFFADTDLAGGGRYGYISLGQFGEDPNKLAKPAGVLGLISSTSLTVDLEQTEARDDGQYGLRINYLADWLNNGTELGLYFLNYHSRYPYASIIAADESCARSSTNAVEAYVACGGFNGSLPGLPGLQKEPLPIDTMRAQLVYPEDIQMYGVSFNTTIGSWSLAGEYSFRPNVPLQVHITDVIFTGLQPAFPDNDIVSDPTSANALITQIANGLNIDPNAITALLPGLSGDVVDLLRATLPSADNGVPSYLKHYRGIDRIAANQLINGYERFPVGQLDLTAIKAWSKNPFNADQVLLIAEAGMTQIFNLPSHQVLQIEGGGANRTHASPGADCTGEAPGTPVADCTKHLNPTQQTSNFADSIAWGIRLLTRMEYNDVVFGWSFKPTFGFFWDVEGVAPYPIQNFVEGRMEALAGTEVNLTPALTGRIAYQSFFGGRPGENTRADRDNLSLSVNYTF
ncbi:DUF1302 family protein [Stagnimonas aquatica]|uniref:DUF1302 family protein n=1 Tax=Stagnimonas aquatica TaxID=2689987 RepID=A0A3N0VE79_9GAMM|nr:DUF1302 family protein [Stagnimonas aquatica]ROH91020.1 DUF1302 family protein [Stagnimonas aquatica]